MRRTVLLFTVDAVRRIRQTAPEFRVTRVALAVVVIASLTLCGLATLVLVFAGNLLAGAITEQLVDPASIMQVFVALGAVYLVGCAGRVGVVASHELRHPADARVLLLLPVSRNAIIATRSALPAVLVAFGFGAVVTIAALPLLISGSPAAHELGARTLTVGWPVLLAGAALRVTAELALVRRPFQHRFLQPILIAAAALVGAAAAVAAGWILHHGVAKSWGRQVLGAAAFAILRTPLSAVVAVSVGVLAVAVVSCGWTWRWRSGEVLALDHGTLSQPQLWPRLPQRWHWWLRVVLLPVMAVGRGGHAIAHPLRRALSLSAAVIVAAVAWSVTGGPTLPVATAAAQSFVVLTPIGLLGLVGQVSGWAAHRAALPGLLSIPRPFTAVSSAVWSGALLVLAPSSAASAMLTTFTTPLSLADSLYCALAGTAAAASALLVTDAIVGGTDHRSSARLRRSDTAEWILIVVASVFLGAGAVLQTLAGPVIGSVTVLALGFVASCTVRPLNFGYR